MKQFAKLFDFQDGSQVLVTIKNELNGKALEQRTNSHVVTVTFDTSKELFTSFDNYGITDAVKFKNQLLKNH